MPILAPETAQQLAIFKLGQIFTIYVNKAEISRRLRQKYSTVHIQVNSHSRMAREPLAQIRELLAS